MRLKAEKVDGLAKEIGKKTPFSCLEQEVFLNLARTFSVLSMDFNNLFKEHGVTDPQFNVLRILRGHGEPVSVYQISDEMISSQPDISRLIDRMKAAGLVEKKRCLNDCRVVWVTLTKKGKSVLKKLDRPSIALHQTQIGHLSKTQLKDLSKLLGLARHPP